MTSLLSEQNNMWSAQRATSVPALTVTSRYVIHISTVRPHLHMCYKPLVRYLTTYRINLYCNSTAVCLVVQTDCSALCACVCVCVCGACVCVHVLKVNQNKYTNFGLILNDQSLLTKQLDMVVKPVNACMCIKEYYKHGIPPTCFGCSCDHLQLGVLKSMVTLRYIRETWQHSCDCLIFVLVCPLTAILPCVSMSVSMSRFHLYQYLIVLWWCDCI
jgi:hypothetical protein